MVKDKQFKIEEENIKENGFSIINFLLIVIMWRRSTIDIKKLTLLG